MKELLERYQQLTERERLLVLISGVAVLVFLFYSIIWSPLNNSLDQKTKAVANQQELLAWVSDSANRVIQLRSSGGSTKAYTGSLPQAVNQTAGRSNITITRMQPQGDEIQVWVDQAAFNDVLAWLQALENLGVNILDVDIAEAEGPGLVKIRRLKLSKL